MEDFRLTDFCVIFALLTKFYYHMKDYSLPLYDLGEIGSVVKKLGKMLGIECDLCIDPSMKAEGYYSLPTLSEDICKIAASFGISVGDVTASLRATSIQLQTLIVELRAKGLLTDL